MLKETWKMIQLLIVKIKKYPKNIFNKEDEFELNNDEDIKKEEMVNDFLNI